VLEYLKSNGGNIADASRVFGINRPVIYDILRKQKQGDLTDRSRAPRRRPRRTAPDVEDKVVQAKNKTRLGPLRLSIYLSNYEALNVPPGTIRHVLRRNKSLLVRGPGSYRCRKENREFVDWYSAKPFEIVQIDLKHIRDHKALSREQIIHLDAYNIPNYQWSALDVTSRFKLIGYSREKSCTNGLCWYLWVISWLRSHGVKSQILFTVDNGEEFGGKSWFKVAELRKLIAGFGCRLTQNHKGHCEENAHLERSHRTDDEEFYIPRTMAITSNTALLDEALGYIYYYNNVREHSSLANQTPFDYLRAQLPDLDESIRYVQPILLDTASVQLGLWSGYNVLTQNHSSALGRIVPTAYPGSSFDRLRMAGIRCIVLTIREL
jgi:transposase InsO family protein